MYEVQDYASKAVVEVKSLRNHDHATFPKHIFGEHEAQTLAMEPNSFLLIFLENALQKPEKYIMAAQNE